MQNKQRCRLNPQKFFPSNPKFPSASLHILTVSLENKHTQRLASIFLLVLYLLLGNCRGSLSDRGHEVENLKSASHFLNKDSGCFSPAHSCSTDACALKDLFGEEWRRQFTHNTWLLFVWCCTEHWNRGNNTAVNSKSLVVLFLLKAIQ